jgi:hypothetical protein
MLIGAVFFILAKLTQMKLNKPEAAASAMKQLGIYKPATLSILWISVCFAFAAAIASTMAVGALNFIIPVLATNISVTSGKLLQAFQYVSFVFAVVFSLGATLFLGDAGDQQQGMMGDEYPLDAEKNMEFDQGMQEGQYGEGQYPDQQYEGQEQYAQEGQYEQQQYEQQQQYQR